MSQCRWFACYAAARTRVARSCATRDLFRAPVIGRSGGTSVRLIPILLLVGGLSLTAVPATAQQCEGALSITRLGGANRFSPPVGDQAGLQALFVDYRDEIIAMLGEANWSGDADDLFAAVAAWQGVTSATFEPGRRIQWMFFRYGGRTPRVGTNLCWAGDEAFEAWEIRFNSNGRWYSMIVPESCGNLALLAEQPLPKVTLDLDIGGLSCTDKTFDFQSSCSDGNASVTVKLPDGSERAAGAGGGSFPFTTEGDYTVTATCTAMSSRGDPLEDSVSSAIAVGCPSCSVAASPAAVELGQSSVLTVAPKAGHGAEVARVLLDGQPLASPYTKEMTHEGADAFTHMVTVETNTGQSAQCSAGMKVAPTSTTSIAPDRVLVGQPAVVTVAPNNGNGAPVTVTLDGEPLETPYTREVVHKDDGVFTHTAKVENAGGSTESSASIKVDKRWTLFTAVNNISGEDTQFDVLGGSARQKIKACQAGVGFGVGAEYKLNYRLGLMFGANFGRCETFWEYDVRDLWGHDDVDVETNLLYAGLNFHLTRPDSRVDFWVGPMVGRFDYSSPSLSAVEMKGMPLDARYQPQWRGETVLGANMGMKIPFWKDCPVGLYLGAMWLDSTMEAGAATISGADGAEAPELSLGRRPLYLNAGIAFDF